MELSYKIATPLDTPLLAELADRIWRTYYPTIITNEQIDYMLEKMYSTESLLLQMDEGQVFTIVSLQNVPIGYVSISTTDKKNYFLHKFYVEVNEHKRGVGTMAFHHLLSQLTSLETIELTVNRQNYKAINFYFKNGFVIKEVADFNIGDGFFMNDFIMIKNNTSSQ